MTQGWHGWDEYAPFYDWENARTVGRRDVRFWTELARRQHGRILELGCGTGRLSIPLLRSGAEVVGIDRSAPMLSRARRKAARAGLQRRARFVRGDIRALPFSRRPGFALVMAPYGMLQSLTSERDLARTLDAVAGVLRRDGVFGIDLVPDLPRWSEYSGRVTLSGTRAHGRLTLRESVRQDRGRRLTSFDQEYVQRRNGRVERHRFSLVFRTLSIRQMRHRLEKAGLRVRAVLGDYQGGPWHRDADVWMMLAGRA
jgi:SAM-dependent methyltransferase